MADFYLDPFLGSGSTHQYIADATMAANNRLFLRRGRIHPISNYRFFASGMYMGAYGEGPDPVLQKAAGPDAWVYIRNADGVTIENVDLDGNRFNGPVLAVANTAGSQAVSNFTLRFLKIHGSPNGVGLYIAGVSGSTVRKGLVRACEFYDNFNHGTQCSTDVQGVRYELCRSYRNGIGVGAHGFSAWAPSASPAPSNIVWFDCVAEDIVDFDGIEGQGFQADDNSSYVVAIGCVARRCGGYGFLFNEADNNAAIGCVAYGNDGPGFGCTGTATDNRFYNNTSVGNARSASVAAEFAINGSSTGALMRNNIAHGNGVSVYGLYVAAGASSGAAASHNCLYGVTTPASGVTPTNTVSADPLLDAGYRLAALSPCRGVGTYIPGARHFGGKKLRSLPDIGAYRYAA